MTILLNGTELNRSLQWTDRFQHQSVVQSLRRTLGGGLVVFNAGVNKGRPITLEATENTGWFTKPMVEAILADADIPDAVYTLDFHGEIFTVAYNHSSPPAASFTPLNPSVPLVDGQFGDFEATYFTGTIRLFTV